MEIGNNGIARWNGLGTEQEQTETEVRTLERVIFHIDVNSAFLSWEAVYRLHVLGDTHDLREIPSAVAGDVKKRHGIILARSIPAKRFGVRTGDMISDATKLCPNLKLVPPHYDLYAASSKAFMKILRDFSPCVEQYSIDEAFCDMSETIALYGTPVVAANLIRQRIKDELGFTVNIGVSCNKLLAKMASDFTKPDRVHTLFPDEVPTKMWPLPVGDLFFVGRATKKKLKNLGINTIGDLAKTDVSILKAHLKKHGELIHDFANGTDVSLVSSQTVANKGYGNSTTIAFDVEDAVTAKLVLLGLSETVATRLREDNMLARVIAVDIVDSEFNRSSHQMTLYEPTNGTSEIYQAACKLFDNLWNQAPIRHLGVHTSKVEEDSGMRQLNLFDMEKNEKLAALDKAIDSIRDRYGADSVMRASFVGSKIYHMSGGIPPEKRKVNYKDVKF